MNTIINVAKVVAITSMAYCTYQYIRLRSYLQGMADAGNKTSEEEVINNEDN